MPPPVSSCACSSPPDREGPTLTRKRVEREQIECHVCSRERRRLTRAVIGRRDLDNVGADELHAAKGAEKCDRLRRREPCHLRRSGARRERRIEEVDIEREED